MTANRKFDAFVSCYAFKQEIVKEMNGARGRRTKAFGAEFVPGMGLRLALLLLMILQYDMII